jgi:hypothetical protein
MADEKEPVTDSRFEGFNPEVEESKRATEQPKPEPPPPKESEPPPPPPRDARTIVEEMIQWVRNTHGSHPRFEELVKELGL